MKSLEQPIRMKNNGQISIVLNAQNVIPIGEILNSHSTASLNHSPEHAALKEIEDELGRSCRHGRNEKIGERNICLDLY